VLRPFYPILRKQKGVVTSEQLGQAMIQVVSTGYPSPIIESNEIKKISMKN
jgi:hypothetical protein